MCIAVEDHLLTELTSGEGPKQIIILTVASILNSSEDLSEMRSSSMDGHLNISTECHATMMLQCAWQLVYISMLSNKDTFMLFK